MICRRQTSRFVAATFLAGLSLLVPSTRGLRPAPSEAAPRMARYRSTPELAAALDAYEDLTPTQRVGQLFLVAFSRQPDGEPTSDAVRLVRELGIGGLVLQKGNSIFTNERGTDLPADIAAITSELQIAALDEDGPGVPLFIAVDHEGDGNPTTHLREGFTPIPSAMAIGATWDPGNARAVGEIVGAELAAVGVNLLLGPSLDVLADPRVDSRGDIGTRSFGGDPYWVGEMGRSYVEGVHEGGRGKVATVAKHFPGHGGSDRLPDEEVATVNKSLSELRRVELPPFSAVTLVEDDLAEGSTQSVAWPQQPGLSDALMTSHIRYRGFQGDSIRSGTKPVSIDPDALHLILDLDGFPFAEWHRRGGLIVADSLGVRAIRRYDDPTGETFRHRAIARQALEAGNDLLILAQFATTPAWSVQLQNIYDLVGYFSEQYETDNEFRARVDEAARRIVLAKYRLYPSVEPAQVAVDANEASGNVGTAKAREVVAEISRDAVTLLRGTEYLRRGSKVVIITDDSGRLDCTNESCGLPPDRADALPDTGSTLLGSLLLDRYGAAGTGALSAADVAEIPFCRLGEALAPAAVVTPETLTDPQPGQAPSVPPGEPCPAGPSVEQTVALLREADWIIFGFADLGPEEVRDLTGHYMPLVNGLAQSTGARTAVLSFGPPYYIDATNFAHLDVFLAAYSKIPPSIEAALGVLMGERKAQGAPPVTIRDADYELTRQLEPDSGQNLSIVEEREPDGGGEEEARELPARVRVAIGPVLDGNGHPVPDGTQVLVTAEPPDALQAGEPVVALTSDGIARCELVFPLGGRVQIHARSGAAESEKPLVLRLHEPTPTPVPTPEPTNPGLSPAGTSPASSRADASGPAAFDLLLSLAAIVLVAGSAASRRERRRDPELLLGALLLVGVGGLSAYVSLGTLVAVWPAVVPSSLRAYPWATSVAVLVATTLGALCGLLLAYLRERSAEPSEQAP